MKRPFFLPFSACFLFFPVLFILGSGYNETGRIQSNPDPQDFVPHELLVKFKEDSVGDITENRGLILNIINQVQGRIMTYLREEKETLDWDPSVVEHRSFHADPYLFHIRIPEQIDLEYALARLSLNPSIEYVEKNGIIRISTDDTYYGLQWGLHNSSYEGRDIHAEDAWTIATGSSDVVVAVIDTGVDYNHDDLQGNLWTNPNEVPDDDIDNDENGFVDDVKGWNFVSSNSDPLDDNIYERDEGECVLTYPYHGTHCAGIIGALGNNQLGISGVCWNIKIMPLKTHDACGGAAVDSLINAIDYATFNGAYLSSNSYHWPNNYLSLKAAISRALAKNRLFIASAGNDGLDIDEHPRYPASYDLLNIISVLATKDTDQKRTSSNYGSDSVDIGAPGEDIYSTKLGNIYQYHSGTSMAAPFVAGTSALALGVSPGLTCSRLKGLIIDEADYVPHLAGKCVSNGRLNAYRVLDGLEGDTSPSAPTSLIAYPKAWNLIEVRWNDNSSDEIGFEIQRKDQYKSAYLHWNCKDNNSTSFAYFQDAVDTTQRRTYTYRVRASNKAGISSFSNGYSALIPYTSPDAPTDLSGQSPTLEQNVNISWTNHAVNSQYTFVGRRIPGETDWEVIGTLSYDDNAYSDNYALAGYTYQYRVRAENPLGFSSYSNTLSIEVIEW